MSFLSILLVASAFYFAHARPDSDQPNDYADTYPDAYPVPEDSSVPITDSKDYQHHLFGFMNEAHARPDSAQPNDYADTYPDAYPVPEDSSVPITDSQDYQHQLFGFMNEVSKAIDQYMTPLMSGLEAKKQDELKNMGMNGFGSYMSYLLFLIDEETEKEKGDGQSQIEEDSLPRHQIIMQFQSPYSLDPDTPYMADTEADDGEEDDEAHAE